RHERRKRGNARDRGVLRCGWDADSGAVRGAANLPRCAAERRDSPRELLPLGARGVAVAAQGHYGDGARQQTALERRAVECELESRGVGSRVLVCATQMEEREGRWTGRLLGEATYGEEKFRAV